MQSPSLGSANTPFKRFLKPDYNDDRNWPRTLSVSGKPLPNPRLISRNLSADNSLTEKKITHLLTLFGQFIDHDITLQLAATGKIFLNLLIFCKIKWFIIFQMFLFRYLYWPKAILSLWITSYVQ